MMITLGSCRSNYLAFHPLYQCTVHSGSSPANPLPTGLHKEERSVPNLVQALTGPSFLSPSPNGEGLDPLSPLPLACNHLGRLTPPAWEDHDVVAAGDDDQVADAAD